LIWAVGGPLYNRAVTSAAGAILRTVERPVVTDLLWRDGGAVVNRRDFPGDSPRPLIPVRDITFNIIFLSVLFAVTARPLSTANVGAYVVAACALFPIHVVALVASIQSIYALHLGPWSRVHYGAWSRNIWGTATHFYDLIGVHASAVALWLIFAPAAGSGSEEVPARPRSRRKKKRQR
jgi:hypothetical protein